MLIGEVAQRSGVSARMLRHYDRLGLVSPTGRTSGGYREYSEEDIRRLFHVESLRTLGLSLDDARRALDEPGFTPADLVGDLIELTRQRIVAEQELLTKLERVDAAGPAEWSDVLRMVTLLRGLESEFGARRQQAILSQDDSAQMPASALAAALLAEKDLNVAGALQWSLARTPGHGVAALEAGLDSADVVVRRRAVAAIAAVPTAEAAAALRRVLDDPDDTARARAALALGSRGSADAVPFLLAMVVEGHRDVEAAEVLGHLTEVSASAQDIVAAMQHTFDNTGETAVRLRITQALAEIPGNAARDALSRLTADEDRTIAVTAATILESRRRAGGAQKG
ncbi:MerR family transcriptional regulator [Rhodococcus gannanensis]|uniref:MerR family transcriptional regulator n=1 Tax=Rhodococcus gannanensis TaxID=1960308 RepID=A0ABW4NWV4_9NOCA